MTPLTIVAAAFVLALLFGTVAVWGAPIFAIPILLVALAFIGLGQMRRRAERARDIQHVREEAAAEKVEFTERDRQTLA